MIDFRRYYLWISVVILLVASIIAFSLKFYESKEAITALIDVTLTSIALIIAILEILMVRTIAENSQIAVQGALNRISEIFSVADISKGIKLAYDIQKYLRSNDYASAHIRLQDLKSIVIPLKNDKRFETLPLSKELPNFLSTLSIDINNLDVVLSGTKTKSIDTIKINGNLENLVSVLLEYENQIKSLNNANA